MDVNYNKIVGTVIFQTTGCDYSTVSVHGYIDHYKEAPFELSLNDYEWNVHTMQELSNGYLLLFTSIGDEQPYSTMFIIKDWKIVQEKLEIPVLDIKDLHTLFEKNRTPKELKELLK